MIVYFISGLGTDRTAFQRIKLPSGYEPFYLDWITPEQNESLAHYALRLAKSIQDEEYILVGLSFGGMVANEIARVNRPKKIIIISSLATSDELPWYFKSLGKLRLQKIIPGRFLKTAAFLGKIMGVNSSEDKEIIYSYVRNADTKLIRWSLNAIVNWKQQERLPGLVHLHGRKDRLLPAKYTHPDYLIDKAGHLMVLNRADAINAILQKELA